ILYLFYSADLLEITRDMGKKAFAGGYIDDTMLVAVSDSVESNLDILAQLTPRCLAWSARHACQFDVKKFQLIHFTKNPRHEEAAKQGLDIAGVTIEPEKAVKYLGILIDSKLRWKEHAEAAVAKATKTLLACARLPRPTFGLPHRHVRRLYISVVLPRLEYGLSVWFSPVRARPSGKGRCGSVGVARQCDKLQRVAARLIAGGFRTTSTDMLVYHADLLPTTVGLNKAAHNAAVRLATLPKSHPLQPLVARAMRRTPRLHRSPLHDLF
ncbi:hypothetical protein EXIGLDRAFT_585415, partial [Exidia glandulosa HHB12029]